MQLRIKQDLSAGLMFLGFGAIFALGAGRYSIGTLEEMGPGFLPLCVGVLLGIVGCFMVARSIMGGQDIIVQLSPVPLFLITIAICVFALIYPYVGMLVAIVVFTFFTARAGAQFRYWEALLIGICLAALCGALFVYGLGIPLPLWPIVRL
jgi:putative tricarboxylic transport membrane protein